MSVHVYKIDFTSYTQIASCHVVCWYRICRPAMLAARSNKQIFRGCGTSGGLAAYKGSIGVAGQALSRLRIGQICRRQRQAACYALKGASCSIGGGVELVAQGTHRLFAVLRDPRHAEICRLGFRAGYSVASSTTVRVMGTPCRFGFSKAAPDQ